MGGPGWRERLAALVRNGPHEAAFEVRALAAYRLGAVACDGPLLVLPVEGVKRAHFGPRTWQAEPGEVLVVHRPLRLDIENLPDEASGRYVALVIAFDPAAVAAARALAAPAGPLPGEPPATPLAGVPDGAAEGVSMLDLAAVGLPLLSWLEGAPALSAARRRLAAADVLLALADNGHTGFLAPQGETLAERIHRVVAADPARDWDSATIEALLAISGATLRRRLAQAGTSLRAVLLEARLRHALGLLQTSRLPVKTVAARCGYASAAAFSRRFAARYGVDPSCVANG